MSKPVATVLALILLVGGIALAGMYFGPLRYHYALYDENGQPHTGYLREVEMIDGKQRLRYEYPHKGETYWGESIVKMSSVPSQINLPCPIVIAKSDPAKSRHQFAEREIFAHAQKVGAGGLTAFIGLLLLLRPAPRPPAEASEEEREGAESAA